MTDYLSEKEQWEQIREWVRQNAVWVLAGVAVGGALLLGWRWWQGYRDTQALQAGARYMQIVQALEQGDRTDALVHLGELERGYPLSAYADQGRLLGAHIYIDSGQLEQAAGELQSVSEHSKDHELALIARQRLARVQIAQGKPDLALATLNAAEPGAFARSYHEARGDAYYAKGDKAAALTEYRAAAAGATEAATADSLLDLKIADLSGSAAAAGAPAATPPAANAAPAAAPADAPRPEPAK
ncbi:MAG: tetratricopeptide repeat protein [Steroidobacteraceae bacterium]